MVGFSLPPEDVELESLDRVCLPFETDELSNVAIPDTTASRMKCGRDI
jgi:hypothetical protein